VRILYHHRTQAEDGQAVHIRALIAAFRALGHTVEEFSLVKRASPSAPGAGASRRYGWIGKVPRFARELMEYGYSSYARRRLVGAGRDFRPDFLYERYAFGNTAGLSAARDLRRPLVLEVNSPMVLELERTRGLSFPRLARRVETDLFRRADRVCVVTGVLRDMLAELGVARERMLVTQNGVDLARYAFSERAETRQRARAELGLAGAEEGELVLGFVGFYRDWHRLDVVLAAMAARELAHTRLVLVGEGPARPMLEAEAARLGLAGRVHFAGPRPHAAIPELLPAFDVALVPAINPYASPLKLFEYMAASLPVIAPDQPNLREVLSDGEDALLVQSGEVEPMRAALVRCSEPGLAARLGAAARATLERGEYTWQGNARRVVAAVEELAR